MRKLAVMIVTGLAIVVAGSSLTNRTNAMRADCLLLLAYGSARLRSSRRRRGGTFVTCSEVIA